MIVQSEYPLNAIGGGDYFTRAAQGEIIEGDPATGTRRREKVVATGHEIDHEGQICIGERTARHLAHLFGMVDGWRVDALRELAFQTQTERDELAAEAEQLRRVIETLSQTEREKVYVGVDGKEYATAAAAQSAGQKSRRLLPSVFGRLEPVAADEAELPETPAREGSPA